ncbi:hypothetical protein ACFLS1_01410 [Verrucomicrobiota bacterium]
MKKTININGDAVDIWDWSEPDKHDNGKGFRRNRLKNRLRTRLVLSPLGVDDCRVDADYYYREKIIRLLCEDKAIVIFLSFSNNCENESEEMLSLQDLENILCPENIIRIECEDLGRAASTGEIFFESLPNYPAKIHTELLTTEEKEIVSNAIKLETLRGHDTSDLSGIIKGDNHTIKFNGYCSQVIFDGKPYKLRLSTQAWIQHMRRCYLKTGKNNDIEISELNAATGTSADKIGSIFRGGYKEAGCLLCKGATSPTSVRFNL